MKKICIIHNCLECQYDSGAECGHPIFERKYPAIPEYPNVPSAWCPLQDAALTSAIHSDGEGRCTHCGAGDDNHHSFTCPTKLHQDRRR